MNASLKIPQKILLVFDNPEQCELLEHQLKRLDFNVHTCRSLATALMMINAGKKIGLSYQWLIVNHNLEDISGQEFRQLQQHQLHNRFAIIYFHDAINYKNLIHLSAANNHVIPLSKRVNFSAFVDSINKIISRSSAGQTALTQQHQTAVSPKVLLIEDNDIGRLMARTLLETLGLTVSEAEHGKMGIDLLAAQHFDLVLTDILMPVMGGLQTIREIRRSHSLELPIIVMSANVETSWNESFATGANGYLIKPFALQTLYLELNKWINVPIPPQPKAAHTGATPTAGRFAPLERVLDLQTGIQRAGGNEEAFAEMLNKYLLCFADFDEQLMYHQQIGNREKLIQLAHSIRGVAGSLGANALQHLAAEVENGLLHNAAEQPIRQLANEHQRLLQALSTRPVLRQEQQCRGTTRELDLFLEELKSATKTHQAKKIKELTCGLKDKTWPAQLTNELTQLVRLLDSFQYHKALHLLAEIEERGKPETISGA